MTPSSRVFILIVLICCSYQIHKVASVDYATALTKCLMYFEGQRSGKLPPNQRVYWRGDSGLLDGHDVGIDLVGGYYDAGDNLKLGFPMAFTITMLSWSTIEFKEKLGKNKELGNTLSAIKWGTDYLMKAHPEAEILYGEVGDPDSDHACWQRPEDMTTPRNSFRIDHEHPGSDLAAETSAALAAASIAFQNVDPNYASQMLSHAIQLFDFARNHQGLYQNSITPMEKVYNSSGYKDELLWAAAWLHRATNMKNYLDYLGGSSDIDSVRLTFSWDDKYLGAQILVAKLVLEGIVESTGIWAQYKALAEEFICSCAQKSTLNVDRTPGGLLWFNLTWNNNQYVSTASFLMSVYSQYLASRHVSLNCSGGVVNPSDLTSLVRSQMNYILGSNPKKMSYMVGYGSSYPQQIHHRGASIVSIKKNATQVTCVGGYVLWFSKNESNPNILEGAVVSPDQNDNYADRRSDYELTEPATYTMAPLVGCLAFLT